MPGQPHNQVTGVLAISESGQVTAELSGDTGNPLVSLTGDKFAGSQSRIIGRVQDGGLTTLDGCYWRNSYSSFPSGVSTSSIHSNIAFIGAAYEGKEEPLFAELRLSIEGLDTWLSISGIYPELDTTKLGGTIHYQVPDSISLTLPWDVELGFNFGMDFPRVSSLITEASVKQTAFVWIKPKEPQSVAYFSSLAIRLCNFLSLALDEAVSIQSMTGYLDQGTIDDFNKYHPVQIYSRFAPWSEKKPNINWYDALFRYPDVSQRLNHMLMKWFESHELFTPAFNLYFATKAQHSQFLDTKILWLTQALEILHRRSSEEKEMSDEEFRNLLESVIGSCPQNRREWLNVKLPNANELSLRQRLGKLLDPFKLWFGDQDKRKAFVNSVCHTRNYLTHYDEDNTNDRAKDSHALFELLGKLEALFQLHLLALIGLDNSSIDSIIQQNYGLRRRLGISL